MQIDWKATDGNTDPLVSLTAGSGVKDDDNDLAAPARAILVTAAGDVAIHTISGDVVTLALEKGLFPIGVKRLLDTGTTATVFLGR